MSQQVTPSSLVNLKRLIYQSDSITNATIQQLHGQGEQLDRMITKTDQIHGVALKNTKKSRQISSIWYYLKDKAFGKYSKSSLDKNNHASVPGEEGKISSLESEEKNNLNIGNPNSLNTQVDKKEGTYDEDLDEILNVMKIVKKNQKNMGQEIDRQKPKIEKVGQNMDKINKQINYSNSLLRKKLNK